MWIHFLPTFHLKKPLTFAQSKYMIKMIDSIEGLNKSEL